METSAAGLSVPTVIVLDPQKDFDGFEAFFVTLHQIAAEIRNQQKCEDELACWRIFNDVEYSSDPTVLKPVQTVSLRRDQLENLTSRETLMILTEEK